MMMTAAAQKPARVILATGAADAGVQLLKPISALDLSSASSTHLPGLLNSIIRGATKRVIREKK